MSEPLSKEQKLANLKRILDFADAEAEKFERRDALRVQATIEDLRQGAHGYLSGLTDDDFPPQQNTNNGPTNRLD